MTQQIREIPPARRQVRLASAVWYRWPLGVIGLSMAVYGGLVALMLFHARGGKPRDDALLDGGGTVRATAEILEVAQGNATLNDAPADYIHYQFTTESRYVVRGHCFGRRGDFARGAYEPVEYLEARPEKNRLVGGRLYLFGDWVSPVLGFVVFPGILLVLLWVQGILGFRRMAARGDVAVALPTRVEPLRWVIPSSLRVSYRFRDHHARWCQGSHWVRARSAVGQQLGVAHPELVLVHDRSRPETSRLVSAADFVDALPVPPESETAQHV